jgi:Ser/Thr protein kinase RdoA (MazF antagonist)
LLRDHMDGSLRLSGGTLPNHIAAGVLALIERLPPGDGLCHADLHPGNVRRSATLRTPWPGPAESLSEFRLD